MGRVLRLRFDVPSIALESWMPGDDDRIKLPFDRDGLAGAISISLSRDSVETEPEVDDQGRLLFERPIASRQLEVHVEADWGADWSQNEPRLKAAQQVTDMYVNGLLSYLAVELGQYWVGSLPIREWGLTYFLKAGNAIWLEGPGESTVLPQKQSIFAFPPFRDFWEISLAVGPESWGVMSHALEAHYEPDLSMALMTTAMRHFQNGEYRAAVVESVTAVEVGLSALIRERCKKKGISHNKFKDVSRDLGVAAYLKILLPLVVDAQELEAWSLTYRERLADSLVPLPSAPQEHEGPASIKACIDLNKIRNCIVHEGWIPSEQEDLGRMRRGIRAAHWLVAFAADATS